MKGKTTWNGVIPLEDKEIIEFYLQRKDCAIEYSKEKYGNYCFSIAKHILNNSEDAEECVQDTWLSAWNSIPPNIPDVLRLFFAGITRNLSINRFKILTAKKRGGGEINAVLEELAECISDESDIEDDVIAEELKITIKHFINSLSEKESNLFIRRYFFAESIKEIAERYNLTPNNVTVILSRTRKKLKKHLEEEGYFNE